MRTIREALARTIEQAGLSTYSRVQDAVNAPACVVQPDPKLFATYGTAMAMGGDQYHFHVTVLVAATDINAAQDTLDDYVTGKGDKSIREFLFRNSNIGLEDVDVYVSEGIGYDGNYTVANTPYIGAVLRVTVTVL